MRRLSGLAAILVLVASSCIDGASQERTVRVDFSHDEFASYYWRFFPRSVEVHPGDAVVFEQEWTGEPHTVTLGTIVEDALDALDRLEPELERLESLPSPDPEVFAEAEEKYDAALADIPGSATFGEIQQNWAQPCYLETGTPPRDPDTPCTDEQQRRPVFDGRQTFYSSGFIPPEGPSGNTFRVQLSDDIAPGRYRFICTIHLPFMTGEVVVKSGDSAIASQSESNAQARGEIEELAGPLRRAYASARAGRAESAGQRLRLPMGGYHAGEEFTVGVSEFIPRTVRTKVGEPVTWTIVGPHTVSFDVPRFVPIFIVDEDGTVRRNPVVDRAAGGSPDVPAVDFESGPLVVDGETWDGSGFHSSGLLGSEPYSSYTLRVSKPGSYKFACLVHPEMVGTLVVTG